MRESLIAISSTSGWWYPLAGAAITYVVLHPSENSTCSKDGIFQWFCEDRLTLLRSLKY